MLEKFHKSRLGVYFYIRRLNTVGKCKAVFAWRVVTCHREFGLEIHGQGVGPEVGHATDFTDRHMFCTSKLIDHHAIDQVESRYIYFQNGRSNIQDVRAQYLASLQNCFSTNASTARCPRATTIRRNSCVACNHANVLNFHTNSSRCDLGEDGFSALALLSNAHQHIDHSRRIQTNRRAILCRYACTAYAIKSRGGVGHFNHGGKSNAAVNAFGAERLLLFAKLWVIHQGQQLIQTLVV